MHLNNELIEQIKGVMAHNRITQKDLAAQLGVSVMTVSRWMTGATSKLSVPVWERLSGMINDFKRSRMKSVIEKPVSSLDINEDETVLCSSGSTETVILPSESKSSLVFKSPVDHVYPHFNRDDLLICEPLDIPRKDQLILMNYNDENLVLWCDGQIDNNFYFRNSGDNTALVIKRNNWSFLACIKEIRIRDFNRS